MVIVNHDCTEQKNCLFGPKWSLYYINVHGITNMAGPVIFVATEFYVLVKNVA